MKSIKPLSVITLVLLTALASAEAAVAVVPPVPAGRVNFNLTALEQMSDTVSLRTNKTSTGTNIVQTVTSKVNAKIAVNSDILKLLVNSITNLPATIVTNAHLATDGRGQFFVVTATTTNNVSGVLSYTTGPWVFSGAETIVTKTPPGTRVSETESATSTQAGHLTYNDNLLTTRDGKHTSFNLSGILVTVWGDNAPKFTQSFKLTGSGDGVVKGKAVVITEGTVRGQLTTSVDIDDL